MQITLHRTDRLFTHRGITAALWEGTDEQGRPVVAVLAMLGSSLPPGDPLHAELFHAMRPPDGRPLTITHDGETPDPFAHPN